jgi:hypothetical protein
VIASGIKVNSKIQPVSERAKKAIDKVLRAHLRRFGYEHARMEPGFDHDGDPAIFIDAHYRLSDEPIDAHITLLTLVALRRELVGLGEDRFPHLRHHFDEKQCA